MLRNLFQRELNAAADCELIRDGLLGQPANTISTAAFPVAAAIVARDPERRLIAAGLAATGLGSALFHGPMVPGSEWAHDVSLAWLLCLVATDRTRWQRRAAGVGLVALGTLFAAAPATDDAISTALAVAAIGRILLSDRSPRSFAALALLALASAVGRLSATGGPLCNPESLVQGHAFWHVASAAAVAIWATGSSGDQVTPSTTVR